MGQIRELILEDDYLDIDDYLVYEAYSEILEEEEYQPSSDSDEAINYLLENDIDINSINRRTLTHN